MVEPIAERVHAVGPETWLPGKRSFLPTQLGGALCDGWHFHQELVMCGALRRMLPRSAPVPHDTSKGLSLPECPLGQVWASCHTNVTHRPMAPDRCARSCSAVMVEAWRPHRSSSFPGSGSAHGHGTRSPRRCVPTAMTSLR